MTITFSYRVDRVDLDAELAKLAKTGITVPTARVVRGARRPRTAPAVYGLPWAAYDTHARAGELPAPPTATPPALPWYARALGGLVLGALYVMPLGVLVYALVR